MDGNHSLLDVVPHLIHCTDVQLPLIINIALGLPANICVILLILAGPGDKAAEIVFLNHAFCEVATCMANGIMLISLNFIGSNDGIFIFHLYSVKFSRGFSISGRPVFMTYVCLERYFAVVRPVTFLKFKPLRYKLVGTITSWMIVLVCSTLLVWVPHPGSYYVTFGIVITPLLVTLFCYAKTLCVLVRPGPGEGDQDNGLDRAKWKAFRIILIFFLATTISYLPYIIGLILFGYVSEVYISKIFCIGAYGIVITGIIPALHYIHRAGKPQHCMKNTA